MESSQYAFLAGLSNFSRGVAQISGAVIFDLAGVTTEGGNCDFSALWWLVLCFHILLPLFVGVGAAYLIPNAKQTDEMNPDGTFRGRDDIAMHDMDDMDKSVEELTDDNVGEVPFIDY